MSNVSTTYTYNDYEFVFGCGIKLIKIKGKERLVLPCAAMAHKNKSVKGKISQLALLIHTMTMSLFLDVG